MAESPVGVGVVGLGRSGWGIHVAALRKMPEWFRIAAVADVLPERTREAAEALGGETVPCDDIDSLLAQSAVELVIVASPNFLHASHAVKALESGRNVVCEKPFGLRVADVDAMLAASREASARLGRPVLLAPFQNRRFEESFRKVREVMASGVLGSIVHIRMAYHSFSRRWDWQTQRSFGGGQLNNNLPHPLDQAMEFFADFGVTDADDIEVFADVRNALSSGDAEDHVRLTLRARNHPAAPTIDIEFTAACPYPQDQWLVMGTAGGLRGTSKELNWKWIDWSTQPERPADNTPTPDRSYNRESLEWQEASHTCTDAFGGWPSHYYGGIYQSIRHGAPLAITPEVIRRRIQIIEKARASAGIPASGREE